ncbi:hypothetical protein COT70_01390 [candidate division WWE3 bacterium CG09_land_8_20_14_0_10_47_33]|uniref:Uncharacterized protein n=1 Tax=candidate division WWE3 bacterium CG_4_9_14_0_2_um_filter_48_10 TaxID=1975078 RepID=A0A2M8EJQ7_UNCKA|nr:MAG: hypothetical protein COT70_01390 [candidate division WWE3 bacterium CG09_land_8_20_14_0_10_47_33]PIZ41457.1 MAG: hypothetical protein COY35_00390 [candidate division WWE3 bacterium CG_4_10_14_0_2_um_filter_47_8]PJC22965.1 MAG: hypothetical protein CO059_01115 [candidate division WWE3 bacterium CG_4_9_14_0_2_um_filter_48_10]PJE51207.1 MAG: hypothetical protein COV28_02555 [candidate division WWE3 bacterium CG10_big_fil_rev_8_21_14_0_10_48_23]
MLDTDEIRAILEEAYDGVCAKVKGTEGTNEEVKWQDIEIHLDHALEILDAIKRPKRELEPDLDLSFPAEGDFKRRVQIGKT